MTDPMADVMTERELVDAIIEMALTFGWLVHHDRPARTEKGWRTPIQGMAGWPDLALARPPRLLFIEAKSERGTASKAQLAWLYSLRAVPGIEVYVIKPRDWRSGMVEALLR